jgi:hypothetical protein
MFGISSREFTQTTDAFNEALRRQQRASDANGSRINILGSSVDELRRRVDEMESRLGEHERDDSEGATWSLDIEERVCRIEKALAALVGMLKQGRPS